MVSRSTIYRRAKGLSQVEVDWDANTWSFVLAETGAPTKRAAVEELLRRTLAAAEHERQVKAECAAAKAKALARMEGDE